MIGIYARQSADKRDSISIETQIEFGKREVFDGEEYKEYSDKGYSGGNIDRPDFKNLMSDIKSGLIKKVIVYRLDRISRSILHFTSMMEIFNQYKVEFVSCSEKLDTSTPAGRMVVNILIVFAQYERESAQQRISDNYYERGKRGVFLGGNTPFGYDYTHIKLANKKASILTPNPEQSLIVKEIYDMYANQGMSLGEIAAYYNQNNIVVGKKGKCNSNTISRILRNPAYVRANSDVYNFLELKGCIMTSEIEDFNGKNGLVLIGEGDTKFTDIAGYYVSVGLHEGLIASDLWLKAQYRIYNNKQIANNGTSKNTWLSGLSKCGYCGYAMTYKSQIKRGKKFEYLRCSGRNNKACTAEMPSWKLPEAEETVFQIFKNNIELSKLRIENNHNTEKADSAKLEIALIDKKINNLVNNLMESDNVSMQYINKAINELHTKKNQLTEKILENQEQFYTGHIDIGNYLAKWDELSFEEKKKFIRLYANKIRFFKDKLVEVDFK